MTDAGEGPVPATLFGRCRLALEALGLLPPSVLLLLAAPGPAKGLRAFVAEPSLAASLETGLWACGCAALVGAAWVLGREWVGRPAPPRAVRAWCLLGLAVLIGLFTIPPYRRIAAVVWPLFVLPGLSGLARLVRPGSATRGAER